MNKITFSHKYYKIPNYVTCATLCFITKTTIQELSKTFLDYDTVFITEGGVGHYDLSNLKDVIILTFLPGSGNSLFTTIRRWTPQKEEYYRSKIGQLFEIVIKE